MIGKIKEHWKLILLCVLAASFTLFLLLGCEARPVATSVLNEDGRTTVKGEMTLPPIEVIKEVQKTTWPEIGILLLTALGANQLKRIRPGALIEK